MTGTVQGIVSNRMASLRSGDAFVTGMSAGNGMSANSGFIQAFGSTGEQKILQMLELQFSVLMLKLQVLQLVLMV
jgi:hypothetical protein